MFLVYIAPAIASLLLTEFFMKLQFFKDKLLEFYMFITDP